MIWNYFDYWYAKSAHLSRFYCYGDKDVKLKTKSWWGIRCLSGFQFESMKALYDSSSVSKQICMTLWLLKSICFLGMLAEEIKHLGGGVGMYEKIAYCHRILEAANENQSFLPFLRCQVSFVTFGHSLQPVRQQESSDAQYISENGNVKGLSLKICLFRLTFLFFAFLFSPCLWWRVIRWGSQGIPATSKQFHNFQNPKLYDGSSKWDVWSERQTLRS